MIEWSFARRKPHPDPSGVYAGLGICGLWLLYVTVKSMHLTDTDTVVFSAVMDLTALFAVTRLYKRQAATWKIALAFAFLAQLCLHVVYLSLPTRSPLTQWRYWAGLDVSYVVECLAIASMGGRRGLRYLHSVLDGRRAETKAGAQQ